MARDQSTRRQLLTATGAATTVALAGCIGSLTGGSGGGGSNEIKYLSDRGDSREIIDQIITEFEDEYDYTVDVTYTSKGTSTDEQLQRMRAAGNPPDIIFDTSADAYRYQRDGKAAQVSDVVQGTGLPDPVNVDGESYFVPTMVEPLMGWYRNDLYPENPTTWETWRTEAQRLTEEEDINGYVVQSGQTNNADTMVTQTLWQNDVNIYDGPADDIQVTIDDDENRQAAVETYEWLQTMSQYAPNGSGWEWGDAIAALQQENAAAAMSVGGLPILTIQANRPDLVEKLSPTAFPVPDGKSQDKWWAYMEGHVVWNDGDATEGARQFVDFFSSSSRFMDFILSAPLFQFPPTREGLDSEAVQNNETIQQHPEVMDLVRDNWDAFTTVLATGRDGAPNIVAADAYGQQLFGQSADQLLVGGRSPEETVDWVASELRGLQG
ncbi:ABC transporter substrate-binding protein [Haloarchaeobius litoreus]|uniref:ABC transporter substrate-binding protein n=1 Tax=Haloarchaeobius litoreus TaxID=755306 RepID=A0ABD6DCN0_9EURY|nr:extracellular solute-binding protein [Haloarchaeobius litoreus]